MDAVGLDTVEHIETHYIKERKLASSHLDWLKATYIDQGKLGKKSPDKGGLYDPPAPGSQTRLLVLNLGLAEPLKGKSMNQIQHSGEILQLTAEDKGSRPIRLLGSLPSPDGIDIATSIKRMYWTNMGHPKQNDGCIQSANLDGSDVRDVIPAGKGLHTPKQLTIDQKSNKIYCCDREGLKIIRCNLDGTGLETIYQSGDWETEPEKKSDATYWPVGIALSTKHDKLFWTQKGHSKASEGRIFCASMSKVPADPARRDDVEIVANGLPECIDLDFDDQDSYLYWTDRGELPLGNTLNRKRIRGYQQQQPPLDSSGGGGGGGDEAERPFGREILAQGLGEGIGLRLHKANRCLYVADLGGRVWKCSTEGGKEKVFEGNGHAYTGIAFYTV